MDETGIDSIMIEKSGHTRAQKSVNVCARGRLGSDRRNGAEKRRDEKRMRKRKRTRERMRQRE